MAEQGEMTRFVNAVAEGIADEWAARGDDRPPASRRFKAGERAWRKLTRAPGSGTELLPTEALALRQARAQWQAGQRIGDNWSILLVNALDRILGTEPAEKAG